MTEDEGLRPGMMRRPTDHELALRPPLIRQPSELLPPPMHQGQFTPELSPLDAFVSRGRILYRQLEQEDRQRRTSEKSQSPAARGQHPQYAPGLQAPPKFSRSHSVGADVEGGVESLSAAVEGWAVGVLQKVNGGGDRATKLYQGSAAEIQRQKRTMSPPPKMPVVAQPRAQSPVRLDPPMARKPSEKPRPPRAAPQGLTIHEQTFRPVSSQVRISGFDFGDDRPISHQEIAVRAPSRTRAGLISPKSPRMPFSDDDDDDDEDEVESHRSFSRVEGVRRDLSRGRGPQIFVGAREEHSPVSLNGDDGHRQSLEDQFSPRNMSDVALPSPRFPARSDSRGSMIDYGHMRDTSIHSIGSASTIRGNRPQHPLTPPNSTSPIEYHQGDRSAMDRSALPKRQSSLQSHLIVPYLQGASTSTPNLPFVLQHHNNSSVSSLNRPMNDDAVLLDGELFLPPQPAFAARSAPASPRPSSAQSDTGSMYTIGGSRRTFNFSRPMSKQSFSSMDGDLSVLRKVSSETYHEPTLSDAAAYEEMDNFPADSPLNTSTRQKPYFQGHRQQMSSTGKAGPAESYIHSQYSLPRGREPQRESIVFFDGERRKFKYDSDGNELPKTPNAIADPPLSPFAQPPLSPFALVRASSDVQRPEMQRSLDLPRPGTGANDSPNRQTSSASTPNRPLTSGVKRLSPQEHLELGITLHEKGSNAESTYHFRLSANGGNPSGMLMYALALRHGWGMRPNAPEAVSWLQRAAEIVQLNLAKDPNAVDAKEIRTKLALAVYELGMSCSNGWGVAVDKKMALQYFELAASWGDCDALSEAGFAYANGAGCKKDLKKSARYYRAAAAKGVSMVGNSWIWKDKYAPDGTEEPIDKGGSTSELFQRPPVTPTTPSHNQHHHEKDKGKEKERPHIFGRKKSSW